MRMGAFLRDRGSLHQSAVDVPINLAIRVNDVATASVGSLAIACSGSLLTGGFGFLEVAGVRFFVIAFIGGLSGVLGADFCVIT
jgi:hypothetical protein